jgi:hypothetical protein
MTQPDIGPYYVLNRNDGVDTLHRNPREQCNVDDAEGRDTLDTITGDALMRTDDIHKCGHCIGEEVAT